MASNRNVIPGLDTKLRFWFCKVKPAFPLTHICHTGWQAVNTESLLPMTVWFIYNVVLVSGAEWFCYIHAYVLLSRFLSIIRSHKILITVLCAIQQVLVVFPFYTQQFSSVQLLSRVRLSATPWTAARQASLSITISRSSLRLLAIESVKPSSYLILCLPFSFCPQSLPASESFLMSQLFPWGGQSTGVSALASFLPKKSQGWYPLEWIGWISLQSKGLSRVFSNTIVWKHQFFGTHLSSQSNSHIHIWPLEKP